MVDRDTQGERGVLFIATSQEFVSEAASAARRIRDLHPRMNMCIVTDTKPEEGVFDHVRYIDDPIYGFGDKVRFLQKTPYSKTIYLDTDIYVCDGQALPDLFALLENFDIAASIDEGRRHELIHGSEFMVKSPDSLPMVNTGVLPFRSNNKTAELFSAWQKVYDRHSEVAGNVNDQPALREALFTSEVRMAPLPPEFNCRLPYSQRLVGPVRILHGRAKNISEVATILNQNPNVSRTVTPVFVGPDNLPIGYETDLKPLLNPESRRVKVEEIRMHIKECGITKTILIMALGGSNDGYLRLEKLLTSVEKDGFIGTCKKMIRYCKNGEFQTE